MESSHYDLLNVSPSASQEEIKARYAAILREMRHRVQELGPSAGTHIDRVRAAYLTLSDPAKRAAYDASLVGVATASAAATLGNPGTVAQSLTRQTPPNDISIGREREAFWTHIWRGEETVRGIVGRLVLPGWFLATLITGYLGSLKAALPSIWPVVVIPIALVAVLVMALAVVGLWRGANKRGGVTGHLVRILGIFVGLITIGFTSRLASLNEVLSPEIASAPKTSNDTITRAFPGLASEGCDNSGSALLRTITSPRKDKKAEEFLKTANGKYLAAALYGQLDLVRGFLDSGADLNARDQRRGYIDNSALDHAARTNNVELAKLLLSRGMDVNIQGQDGHTALHVAIGLGRRQIAEYLLSRGANPDIGARIVGTPLEVAVLQARPTMAKVLLKYDAGKNAHDRSSPLKSIRNAAVLCPAHQEIIRLLIDSGTDLFATDSQGRSGAAALVLRGDQTAMMLAKDYPSVDWNSMVSLGSQRVPLLMVAKCASSSTAIEYLLNDHPRKDLWRKSAAGSWGSLLHCPSAKPELDEMVISLLPDVNVTDAEGRTALHRVRNFRTIDVLVKRGVRFDIADKNGRTPLYEVIHETDVLAKFLDSGANPFIEDDKGMTVLEHAASSKAGPAVSILLGRKMDSNRRNREGGTPLHVAIYRETAVTLIRGGADVHAQDANGLTPLHSVAARSAEESIEVLLKAGADVMARAKDGTIPLHHVRRHETVPTLIKANPDSVHAVDRQGRTPIHAVGSYGSGLTIRLLLDNGANVNAVDLAGNTPLHLAAERGTAYGIAFLVKFGANPALANRSGKTPFDLVRSHPKAEELTKALRGEQPPS